MSWLLTWMIASLITTFLKWYSNSDIDKYIKMYYSTFNDNIFLVFGIQAIKNNTSKQTGEFRRTILPTVSIRLQNV